MFGKKVALKILYGIIKFPVAKWQRLSMPKSMPKTVLFAIDFCYKKRYNFAVL